MKKNNHRPKSNQLFDFIFYNKKMAPFWLLVRLYVGYKWLHAGVTKLFSPTWIGSEAPQSLLHFLNNTLDKATGPHASVMGWYAYLTQHVFIPLAPEMSYLVVAAEILVGLCILFGFWIKKAAIVGGLLNINYMLAGSISINPVLLILEILLILSAKIAGYFGVASLQESPKKSK